MTWQSIREISSVYIYCCILPRLAQLDYTRHLYALNRWQMHNAAPGLNPRSKAKLAAVVNGLRHCAGQGTVKKGGCRLEPE